MSEPTGIIGVDPGLNYPGFAELDVSGKLVRWGVVSGKRLNSRVNMSIRCWKVASELMSLIVDHRTFRGLKIVGIEGAAYYTGAKFASYEQMARIRQAIFDQFMINLEDIVIYEPTPQQVKRAVTGQPGSGKDEVVKYVLAQHRINLPASKFKREAAADAIAIAHATRGIWKRKILEGVAASSSRTTIGPTSSTTA